MHEFLFADYQLMCYEQCQPDTIQFVDYVKMTAPPSAKKPEQKIKTQKKTEKKNSTKHQASQCQLCALAVKYLPSIGCV